MNNEELILKLKAIVSAYAQNKEELERINENTDFINDLKINSAHLVDVVLDVEEAFDIIIDNQSMERMLTVKAAMEIIETKVKEKMIGNDIVDLQQAEIDSNWRRKGYLDKIFTAAEQSLIIQNEYPSGIVWLLWSMKEAAYKIHNRETNLRTYAPLKLVCNKVTLVNGKATGMVSYEGSSYFTNSKIDEYHVHTIAAIDREILDDINIFILSNDFRQHPEFVTNDLQCVSHHGRYLAFIYI